MSSTNPTINKKASINQMPLIRSVKAKSSKHSKKVMIHQSGPPLPPDDFVLFPQDIVKEKHSSIKDARSRRPTPPKSAKRTLSPMPRHHVIEPKAASASREEARRPSRRPVCFDHMSTVNCTVDCANGKPPAHLKVPPKAPSLQRLATPDLSEVEEDDFWSCCGSSWTSLSDDNNRCNRSHDGMWDEMEEKLTQAKAWQSRSSTDSRKAALKRDR